jgi:hypothetical protein
MGLPQHAQLTNTSQVDMCAALQQTYVTRVRPVMGLLQRVQLISTSQVDTCVAVQQIYVT